MKHIISFLTRFIPRHYLQKISHIILQIVSLFLRGNKFEDPINNIKYSRLLPYGRIKSRKNALAPDSLSLERHRLIWLYLKEKTNFFTDKINFLHIAPEYCFIKRFKKLKNIKYTTADLISPWADIKMDVHEIPFTENVFDVIMCNHVLEHVQDDEKVMKEFYRVMKEDGWGIFQVPIEYKNEKTLEDPKINTPQLREKYYWQSDHMRLYGKDFAKKLRAVGFTVIEDNFINEIDPNLKTRYCLPKEEIIYLCKK